MTGFWHIEEDPQSLEVLKPTVDPNLVTLPDDGSLPEPTQGVRVAWYGDIAPRVNGQATNTFLGDFDPEQGFKTGGNSYEPNTGDLISPAIDLPAAPPGGRILLQYKSWWEVESVDVHEFDIMEVFVSTDGGVSWDLVDHVNPHTDVDGG